MVSGNTLCHSNAKRSKRMYVDPSIAVASESVPVYFLMSALPFRSSIMVNCVKSLYRHGLSIVGGINFCLGLRVDAAINQYVPVSALQRDIKELTDKTCSQGIEP